MVAAAAPCEPAALRCRARALVSLLFLPRFISSLLLLLGGLRTWVPDWAIEVPGVGCIVDGVPPRMQLTEEDIQIQLDRRRPGQKGAGSISTGRNEDDAVQILSGAHPAPPWARARAQRGNLSAAGE